jgi:hypothetical protein
MEGPPACSLLCANKPCAASLHEPHSIFIALGVVYLSC